MKVSNISAPPPIITGKYIFSTDSKEEAFAWMEAEDTKEKLSLMVILLAELSIGGGPKVGGEDLYDIETCQRLQKRFLAILEDEK